MVNLNEICFSQLILYKMFMFDYVTVFVIVVVQILPYIIYDASGNLILKYYVKNVGGVRGRMVICVGCENLSSRVRASSAVDFFSCVFSPYERLFTRISSSNEIGDGL